MKNITVLKRDLDGEVTWQYKGRVLERGEKFVLLEAFFDREDMPFVDVTLKRGDRFVETFYTERWYNVFEIHDRDDGNLKGWYCNIGFPAVLGQDTVSYIDLALDLWVSADGTQTVLDEDEFQALPINTNIRTMALVALDELKQKFKTNRPLR